MYLSYTEYQAMGGILDDTTFTSLEFRARKQIDKHTFGRLKELDNQVEAVKRCIFDLIDKYNTFKGDLKSESVDGWSKTYLETTEQIDTLNEIIEDYLATEKLEDGTPYLYRGL